MNKKDLEPNKTDVITSVVSTAAGYIPIAGGVISEIIRMVIPKQREDRIVKFLANIDKRLSELEITVEKSQLIFKNTKYGGFTFECLRDVVNDKFEEKMVYYQNLYITGITSEEQEMLNMSNLMRLVSDMDYKEILYLKFYYYADYVDNQKIQEVQQLLNQGSIAPNYTMNMNQKELDNETYKQITLNALVNKGLLERKVEYIGKNRREKIKYKLTSLGRLLLRKIGEINDE